jgi:hypothetical protein
MAAPRPRPDGCPRQLASAPPMPPRLAPDARLRHRSRAARTSKRQGPARATIPGAETKTFASCVPPPSCRLHSVAWCQRKLSHTRLQRGLIPPLGTTERPILPIVSRSFCSTLVCSYPAPIPGLLPSSNWLLADARGGQVFPKETSGVSKRRGGCNKRNHQDPQRFNGAPSQTTKVGVLLAFLQIGHSSSKQFAYRGTLESGQNLQSKAQSRLDDRPREVLPKFSVPHRPVRSAHATSTPLPLRGRREAARSA